MTKSQFSISEVHRITGKSRTTINKHLEEGKLSFQMVDGKRVVDAAELMRVYGSDCNFDKVSMKKTASGPATETPTNSEDRFLKQQLENERKERERERSQFLNQIEHLQDSLGTAQEGHNRATLLLENHSSGGGALQAALDALEQRMSNQELTLKEEQELALKLRRQNLLLKRAIQNERGKSFWERLFGGSRAQSSRPANSSVRRS